MEETGQHQNQAKKFKSEPDGAAHNNSSNNNNNNTSNNGDVPRSKRVYVANVPFDVKITELKDLFREKIGEVTHCTIFENEDGKSRGCGLIEFQDVQTAARAIEVMHRSEFKNRELVVKEDLDCERDRFGRIITGHGSRNRDDSQRRDGGNRDNGRSGGGGGGGSGNRGDRDNRRRDMQQQQQHHQNNSNNNYGYDHSIMSNAFAPHQQHNTFGLSQQFLDSLGINLPLNNRIFVANLEYKVDQDKLEEIFKLAGKVAKVKLSTDQQGQSRGYGTVEYEHPVEAVQAISMFHNQKLFGRTMSVRMDKYECEDDIETIPSKLPSGLETVGKGLGINGQPLNVAKSIMNAALIAPPHLATMAGQPIPPQMHPQAAVQQPAAMQQAVIAAQMQQLQQQHQQQHHQQHLLPQTTQQTLPPTMQHQLQQSLQQNPLQQQYQMQLSQPAQGLQQNAMSAYSTMQQLQAANAVRPPQATAANVYQQPQQAPPQQTQAASQAGQQQQQQLPQQTAPAAPAGNLSVFSTFERQFREASAPQNFTRN